MKIKHVQLRDFNLRDTRNIPLKNVEVKWVQQENNETQASIIGNKQDINNQLAVLNNKIMSDRLRTVRNAPKCRIIKTRVEGKPEMVEEIKEYY